MNEIKFFDTAINSESAKFSIQATIPTINNEIQPMEMAFYIEFEEGEPLIMTFDKDQAGELLKELQRIVPLVECFG